MYGERVPQILTRQCAQNTSVTTSWTGWQAGVVRKTWEEVMKALITRKLGMSTAIGDDGSAVAITLLSASPNVITQIKNSEVDGYKAVQVGFEKAKKMGKAQAGHYKKAKVQPKVTREFIISELTEDMKIGSEIKADSFNVGDVVDATGVSKGKGFAGTIKRHNMKRGPKSHGGRSYRRIGSIGSMYPQKIFKGKRMAGHMGHDQRTVKNLKIALVDTELNVIGVTGAVPGPRKGIVLIKEAK